ncbi:MAG: macro domain-containing protein [Myxococcales bacterium]|nr:macro domain-containing protein [Myxococcales bacterium]
MAVKVTLVDVNPKMVAAWREVFADHPEVDIKVGSMLDQAVDVWVCPTNPRGQMDGGLDAVIKRHLGPQIQTRVQAEIAKRFQNHLGVGCATCVATGAAVPRFLVSTASVASTQHDARDTVNVALAAAAAFQAVAMKNRESPGAIQSMALPGLGANHGKVPVEICADLMWTAYALFIAQDFAGFAELRLALEDELGALGNAVAQSAQGVVAQPPAPAVKAQLAPMAQPKVAAAVPATVRRAGVMGPVVPLGPVVPGVGGPAVSRPSPARPSAVVPGAAFHGAARGGAASMKLLPDFDDSE